MTLTVGSLFAGIGGFDLAFEAAGFEIAFQVEVDPFCLRVLEKHWPTVQRFHDVRQCHGWTGSSEGFPVRISRPLEHESALTASDPASGASSSGSWTKDGPTASSSKTSTMRGGSGCPSCGAPCGSSGMPLCQFACAPVILGPPMNEAASSSLPTLTHQSYGSNRGGAAGRSGTIRPSLPTLMKRDARTEKGARGRPNSIGGEPLLPTLAKCGNYNRKGASAKSGDGLATAVGGRLNPTWCEWFMAFPRDWTDVAWPTASGRSGTPSSRRSSSGSRVGSRNRKP